MDFLTQNSSQWKGLKELMVEGRVCNCCKDFKPWESFAINKKGLNDRKSICKVCSNRSQVLLAKRRREEDPEAAYKLYRSRLLRKKYGISQEIYDTMLYDQGGCCAICEKPYSGLSNNTLLFVDHCHNSEKVRGLLCYHCNTLLGMAFDNPEILRVAAKYLEKDSLTNEPS